MCNHEWTIQRRCKYWDKKTDDEKKTHQKLKYNTNNQIKRDTIDSPNTQIYARIFSCYGTGNSTTNVGGRY